MEAWWHPMTGSCEWPYTDHQSADVDLLGLNFLHTQLSHQGTKQRSFFSSCSSVVALMYEYTGHKRRRLASPQEHNEDAMI